jgi:hypothetical protein
VTERVTGFLDPTAGADEEEPAAGSVKADIRRDGQLCCLSARLEIFLDSVVGLAARP